MNDNGTYREKELLLQISEGEEPAFRQIFQHYGDQVHANIYTIVKSHAIAKDLVQDTFLRVWLYRDKLPGIDNFRQWLMRIGYNRAFTYLRDKSTQEKGLNIYIDKYADANSDNPAESALLVDALRRAIGNIVVQMPPQQRKIYTLSREQGLKIPEIADQLGISPNTVKNTLVKALHALREGMEKAGFSLIIISILNIF